MSDNNFDMHGDNIGSDNAASEAGSNINAGMSSDLSDMAKFLSSMATQLSFYSTELGDIKSDVNAVKVEVTNLRTEYGDRIKVLEEDEGLKPYMINNVEDAVRNRISELLEITWDKRGGVIDECAEVYGRYYSKFCGRLHNDAKRERIEASSWKFTQRKNYQKLINFIADWVPARGVEGLKRYFDTLASARNNTED